MALPITTTAFTDAVRRATIRDLADVTAGGDTTDDDLDRRAATWDPVALSYFGLPADTAVTDADPYAAQLVQVANMLVAAAVRMGLGGEDNREEAKLLERGAMKIVKAYNGIAPEQAVPTTASTPGINLGGSYGGSSGYDGGIPDGYTEGGTFS